MECYTAIRAYDLQLQYNNMDESHKPAEQEKPRHNSTYPFIPFSKDTHSNMLLRCDYFNWGEHCTQTSCLHDEASTKCPKCRVQRGSRLVSTWRESGAKRGPGKLRPVPHTSPYAALPYGCTFISFITSIYNKPVNVNEPFSWHTWAALAN